MLIAEVAVPVPIRQTFHYRVPQSLARSVHVGSRVNVPFGKRELTGFVVAVGDGDSVVEPSADFELRNISNVPDNEPPVTMEILRLTEWTAEYYAASWGELLKAALPAGLSGRLQTMISATARGKNAPEESGRVDSPESVVLAQLIREGDLPIFDLKKQHGARKAAKAIGKLVEKGLVSRSHRQVAPGLRPKTRKTVRLVAQEPEGSPGAQTKVIESLVAAGGEMSLKQLLKRAGVSNSPVNTLANAGVLEIFESEVRRDPFQIREPASHPELVLTAGQEAVLEKIAAAIDEQAFKTFLLHGVTGSGKTEVYIRAIKRTLAAGRSALMLVPEIALTPIFSNRLRAVFGDDVAILHSSLSKGERYDEWRRVKQGAARVIIGTRSAVFAPLKDVGLIVVDEEHDASYRQHESPFYHARDVALVRAKFADAVAVLGSATPALESFYNAKSGKYEYLSLPERIGERPLATAEIIDLREAFKAEDTDPVLSAELRGAIAETHSKGEQSIILLNRRGYSCFVLCRSCGETIKCRNCDITLTFHKGIDRLVCHYCNFRQRTPTNCPNCDSGFLYFMGEGTEQLEKVLRKEFPELKISRVDRDTTRKRKELESILHDFSAGKIDMLTGTQMLAKGHDFPNVTLVGVVSVDTGLALPDFRSAERTFQLITQVAGRAGRGDRPGRVLIQTYFPEHYALVHAREQSYEAFYEDEIKFRGRFGYPPFTALASIIVRHRDIRTAAKNAGIIRASFREADPEGRCSTLGPAPAALSRLKGEFRLQIVVRSRSRTVLKDKINAAIRIASDRGCEMRLVSVEIDPVNLL